MGAGGTEAFPGLGRHCQHSGCNQLDFLPFNCNGCQKTFCSDHRSYETHQCPKLYSNSRKVIICKTCSQSIETTGKDDEDEEVKKLLESHEKSTDCDPSKKRKKPKCPVRRCNQILTFSNNSTCRICQVRVCLGHRFPADHACKGLDGSPRIKYKSLKDRIFYFICCCSVAISALTELCIGRLAAQCHQKISSHH